MLRDEMTRPLLLIELVWGRNKLRVIVVTGPHGLVGGRQTTRWARRRVGCQSWTRHSRRRGTSARTARTSLRPTTDTNTTILAICHGTRVHRRPRGCGRIAILTLAQRARGKRWRVRLTLAVL
jgi:hypothetical protein